MTRRRTPETPQGLRIHPAVAPELGIAILAGTYGSGDRLLGEIEQSLALGVSRTAYREALRILVSKGFLESRPKAGTHVTPRSRWNLLDPDILDWIFSRDPDETFILDLFELRGIIESAAAELAAQRRSEAQVTVMAQAVTDMRYYSLATDKGQAADQLFHRAVLEATHNDALASLSSSVGAAPRPPA